MSSHEGTPGMLVHRGKDHVRTKEKVVIPKSRREASEETTMLTFDPGLLGFRIDAQNVLLFKPLNL